MRSSRLITRTANLDGLADLTALPGSTIVVARGDTGGNNSAGIVNAPTGAWTQTISQTYLLNNAPGQTTLKPLAIAASNSTGQAFLAADGADTGPALSAANPGGRQWSRDVAGI